MFFIELTFAFCESCYRRGFRIPVFGQFVAGFCDGAVSEAGNPYRGNFPSDYRAGANAFGRGDYDTALRVLLPLAEMNDAEAQFALGVMYRDEHGLPQDDLEAAKWYGKAAYEGLGKALAELGKSYEHGLGVARDLQLAYAFFTLAELRAPSSFIATSTRLCASGLRQSFRRDNSLGPRK